MPEQWGFGVSRGVEAAASRIFQQKFQQDQAIVKVDFKNTFDSNKPDRMLFAVESSFLICFHASTLLMAWWGDEVVPSLEGVQQGDPLGSLLLCFTIHKVSSNLKFQFVTFYLDDGMLGGLEVTVTT